MKVAAMATARLTKAGTQRCSDTSGALRPASMADTTRQEPCRSSLISSAKVCKRDAMPVPGPRRICALADAVGVGVAAGAVVAGAASLEAICAGSKLAGALEAACAGLSADD